MTIVKVRETCNERQHYSKYRLKRWVPLRFKPFYILSVQCARSHDADGISLKSLLRYFILSVHDLGLKKMLLTFSHTLFKIVITCGAWAQCRSGSCPFHLLFSESSKEGRNNQTTNRKLVCRCYWPQESQWWCQIRPPKLFRGQSGLKKVVWKNPDVLILLLTTSSKVKMRPPKGRFKANNSKESLPPMAATGLLGLVLYVK